MVAKKKGKKTKKTTTQKRKVSKQTATQRKTPMTIKLLEAEINRLQDLLEVLKRKSSLVRRSLNYIEREQKRVMKQIQQARSFINRLKKRGMKTLKSVPRNLEGLYNQFLREVDRISKYLSS
jgi:chromosome segregation ATPase